MISTDQLTAIKVLNSKMSILSGQFRKDDGGWISEKAYVKWMAFRTARDLLRR